ncbi:MAG: hypothetical protein JNK10_04820 [Cyclobacteriaceae bacterium]|nr:hypothetical protein [Cyclobacteriaceae bacterium]
MKTSIGLFLVFVSLHVAAQKEIKPTIEFSISGEVIKELTFTLADIGKLPSKSIPDVAITNHLGEPRNAAKQLTGILLKDLIKDVQLKEESPKRFSEFYFTFIAVDNYKVVYSWNEIFNSPTGDNLYVITSRDGKKLSDMEDRILILTPTDFKTGRRHIKGLAKISVSRAE